MTHRVRGCDRIAKAEVDTSRRTVTLIVRVGAFLRTRRVTLTLRIVVTAAPNEFVLPPPLHMVARHHIVRDGVTISRQKRQ